MEIPSTFLNDTFSGFLFQHRRQKIYHIKINKIATQLKGFEVIKLPYLRHEMIAVKATLSNGDWPITK